MNLVWKLLRHNISLSQLLGFCLANLVGMLIILVGIQFYADTQSLYKGEDTFMRDDFLIINKKVGTVTTLTGASNTFTESEIAALSEQSFSNQVGRFRSSDFDVRARFQLEEFTNFSTEMFFESVPDEFIDVHTGDWTYRKGQKELPIILPQNYLDLYNFGYAQSRNMPKLSEGIMGAIKLQLRIDGRGHHDAYVGRIVGFSSRINTILVPESFLQWANTYYSDGNDRGCSRVILKVNNPTDTKLTTYLQDNNYQTDEAKLKASKTTFVLRTISSIVTGIGLIISVLSFYILILSIYLLVQKNTEKLHNLMLIGYTPAQVARPYQLLTIGLNALVLLIAGAAFFVIRALYIALFESFFPTFSPPTVILAVAVGLLLLLFVCALDVIIIRRKINTIWTLSH
jgi:hypothetical protein